MVIPVWMSGSLDFCKQIEFKRIEKVTLGPRFTFQPADRSFHRLSEMEALDSNPNFTARAVKKYDIIRRHGISYIESYTSRRR